MINLSEPHFSHWKFNRIVIFIQRFVVKINCERLQYIVLIIIVFIKGSDSPILPSCPGFVRRGFLSPVGGLEALGNGRAI